jgi:hypothetical protein
MDMQASTIHLNGEKMEIPESYFVLYSVLVIAAKTGDRRVCSLPNDSVEGKRLQSLLKKYHSTNDTMPLYMKNLSRNENYVIQNKQKPALSTLWSYTCRVIRRLCKAKAIPRAELLIPINMKRNPSGGRGSTWQIDLPPDQITINGLERT